MGGADIKRHEMVVGNPQSEGEGPESEVMEENHKRGKDEQGIAIGTKKNVK